MTHRRLAGLDLKFPLFLQDISLGNIRRFIGRHELALSIIGALIVLATFVAREEFQGKMAAAASTLNTEKSLYITRRDLSEARFRIEMTSWSLAGRISALAPPPAAPSALDIRDRFLVSLEAIRLQMLAELRAYENLGSFRREVNAALNVPRPEDARLKPAIETFQKSYEAELQNALRIEGLGKSPSQLRELDQELQFAIRNLGGLRDDAGTLIDLDAGELERAAEVAQGDLRRKGQVANMLSIFLFLVGWILGLASKIGEDKGKSEERPAL